MYVTHFPECCGFKILALTKSYTKEKFELELIAAEQTENVKHNIYNYRIDKGSLLESNAGLLLALNNEQVENFEFKEVLEKHGYKCLAKNRNPKTDNIVYLYYKGLTDVSLSE